MIALILSHFPLHSLLFPSFSLFPPLSFFLFLSFFSTTCLSPLATSLLSCVTFPLIYPFKCNRNHPRYSLISGQSYQRLSSELGLIAGMLMTHRMGSWAPECRLWRWSRLCCPKPQLQIWPERREIEEIYLLLSQLQFKQLILTLRWRYPEITSF